jgi:glycosyltransferase involved in cell wall biosynthesis
VEVLSGPQTGSEGSLIDEARQYGIPLTILPELVRQIDPLKDAAALVKLRRFIRWGNFQIVHTHSSKAGVLARLAAHLEGVPVIVHTVHGWSFHDYMPPPTRRVYQLLERYLSRFSSAFIVVSESDKAKGLAAGIGNIEKYRLIRSAIPFKDFDPSNYDCAEVRSELGLSADAVVIGCVGRFSAQKNPLDWIKAAGNIARSCPQVQFLLVGDGPLRAQVESAAAEQGIADRLVLTGLRRDSARMMMAMDIFLLTSLWEGLPRHSSGDVPRFAGGGNPRRWDNRDHPGRCERFLVPAGRPGLPGRSLQTARQ